MRVTTIILATALIPFIAVHLSWLNSLMHGWIPSCFPYFEGCTTISRAARSGHSIYLFRALMLPSASLLILYWLFVYEWLIQLKTASLLGIKIMRILGIIGALFLVLYAVYLGADGEFNRWMRRYGVTIYFSFTALAQIFLTRALYTVKSRQELKKHQSLINTKMTLCIAQWTLGLISIPLGLVFSADKEMKDIVNNVIEWNFALFMQSYFFITYFMMLKTGFSMRFQLIKRKR